MKYRAYKKGTGHSYAFGAFPTMELLEAQPAHCLEVIVSSTFPKIDMIREKADRHNIAVRISDTDIRRLAHKGNVFVIGVFQTDMAPVVAGNHLVLHEVSDMGNLGNICRTALAMGCKDLITIGNTCDIYHPKTVRASMGAIFRVRHTHFEDVESYQKAFPENALFPFMLATSGSKALPEVEVPKRWSIVFGNEGAGLPDFFAEIGTAVRIPQSEEVDSLNLTTAVAIGLYTFTVGENHGKAWNTERKGR